MQKYVVTLYENKTTDELMLFECQADNGDHAREQALDAYPEGEIRKVSVKREGGVLTFKATLPAELPEHHNVVVAGENCSMISLSPKMAMLFVSSKDAGLELRLQSWDDEGEPQLLDFLGRSIIITVDVDASKPVPSPKASAPPAPTPTAKPAATSKPSSPSKPTPAPTSAATPASTSSSTPAPTPPPAGTPQKGK